jgi:hypothetical protein
MCPPFSHRSESPPARLLGVCAAVVVYTVIPRRHRGGPTISTDTQRTEEDQASIQTHGKMGAAGTQLWQTVSS